MVHILTHKPFLVPDLQDGSKLSLRSKLLTRSRYVDVERPM